MLTNSVTGSCLNLKTIGDCLAGTEVDEVGLVTGRVSMESMSKHRMWDLRSGCSLSSFSATGLAIRLAVLLNIGWVESQRIPTTVVSSVVATVVLAVVLSVLTVVLSILAIVLSILSALAELGIGDAGCKQHRDEGREAHDESWLVLESKGKRVASDWRWITKRQIRST
jgi:hypothetical protein